MRFGLVRTLELRIPDSRGESVPLAGQPLGSRRRKDRDATIVYGACTESFRARAAERLGLEDRRVSEVLGLDRVKRLPGGAFALPYGDGT